MSARRREAARPSLQQHGSTSIRARASAPPSPLTLTTVAVAGCAAAAYSFVALLRHPSLGAELGEPLVVALLANWLTASYILCGLFAWWRRPDSRFGPLMVAAGFANFISTLSWTTNDVTFTLGQALDLLPPVLFLHVFLAFPSGRLHDPFERALVASAYLVAVALQVTRMTLRRLRAEQSLRAHVQRGRRSAHAPRGAA